MSRIKAKSKVDISDAKSAIQNAHNDAAALDLLRQSIGDDFPDLDLETTNIADAVESFGSEIEAHQLALRQNKQIKNVKKKVTRKKRRKRK